MPTDFWGGWIAAITIVSLLGLAWVIYSVYFTAGAETEVAHEVWDETLREGATPAPLWWFWFILALLAATVVYLMLYPGLGTFRGVLAWSQGGRFTASEERYEREFGATRASIAQASTAALRDDAVAMRSAQSVFKNHCAACHGESASGQAQLFPNLVDADWQWGGREEDLTQTITLGRQAVMPPLQAALNDAGVAQVADYVLALGNGNAGAATEGARLYQTYCSACHGADGAGQPLLGAPALNDAVWLYGGSAEAVRTSIAFGRTGVMPAFGERLDGTQIKILIAWLQR
jgi:cytochrome c oxidase cbb3-type subunit 3